MPNESNAHSPDLAAIERRLREYEALVEMRGQNLDRHGRVIYEDGIEDRIAKILTCIAAPADIAALLARVRELEAALTSAWPDDDLRNVAETMRAHGHCLTADELEKKADAIAAVLGAKPEAARNVLAVGDWVTSDAPKRAGRSDKVLHEIRGVTFSGKIEEIDHDGKQALIRLDEPHSGWCASLDIACLKRVAAKPEGGGA